MSDHRETSLQEELSHRPLLLAFIALTCGLASTYQLWLAILPLPLLLIPKTWTPRALILIAALLGFLLKPTSGEMMVDQPRHLQETAQIITIPEPTKNGSSATVTINDQRVRIRFNDLPHYVPGDQIQTTGELKPLPEGTGFARGATAAFDADQHQLTTPGLSLLRPGLNLRDHFADFLNSNLSEDSASFVRAVCFGDTSQITTGQWDAFQRSGTTHVVSTSGLHATITAALIFTLLSLLPIGRIWRMAGLAFALILYASASGFNPPVIRAGIMVFAWQSAYLFRREPDGLSALCLAGILNLLIDPYTVAEVGFWLSMVAVGALVLFVPVDKNTNWLKSSAKATTVVTIGTAPIVAAVFGRIPLIGLLANLVIVPLVTLIVTFSLTAWLVATLIPPLGKGLLNLIDPLAQFTINTNQTFANLPYTNFEAPYLPIWLVVILTLALAALWRPHVRPA